MMFRISVECCFLLLLVRAGDTQYNGDNCSFNNSAGVCRSLRDCPSLLALVQQHGLGDNRVRDILRRATCSYDDAEPFVCCIPASSIPSVDEVAFTNPPRIPTHKPTRPTTSTPDVLAPDPDPDRNPTGESRPAADGVLDVSNHRNLQLLPSNCGLLDEDRIWGGNRTSLFEFPWMVLIAYDSARGTRLSCAGTLISRRYVLTAAHCVSHLGSKLSLAGVVVGEHDVRRDPDCERVEGELTCAPPSKNVTIQQVIAHPNYTPQKLFDDIALLRLAEAMNFNQDNLKAVCLPTTRELAAMDLAGIQTVVTGWGSTENGLGSPVLLKVELPVQTNSNCSEAYRGTTTIYPSQLCAGGVPDKDSCGGDSGGPLQYPGRTPYGIRYIQHGIVSYGSKRCGIGGFPGVYTRVSHYMNWILNNMRD